MVITYLTKLQEEYLQEKLESEKELNRLQLKSRETEKFILLLEETNDPNYESFTPREVNSRNKKKILELEEEQKEIQESIAREKTHFDSCQEKLAELEQVIKEAKNTVARNELDIFNNEKYRASVLETQENERQRISRELHDSTVQNLTSMVHKTELCSKLVEMDPLRCKLELTTMSKTLREIINDTRQMIYNLRPMSFDDIGLDVTIERALDKLEYSETRSINFSVEGEPYQIKPIIGITLLRIIQEACNNAIHHANPTLIQVILKYEEDDVSVVVTDDGTGFDVKANDTNFREDNSGFGLSMMKERVYLLSGTIHIESEIGKGTSITVKVPIRNKEDI